MFETRAPAAKFTTIGATIAGQIVDVRRTQQTEYGTRLPYYWENKQRTTRHINPMSNTPNDPMLQTEITIDCGKPVDENGGTRLRLFVRGKRMTEAFRQAIAAGGGGEDGLLIGGHLTAAWTSTEPSQGGGADAKLYRFTYRPPAAGEGRKPDPTPVLAGGAAWLEPAQPHSLPSFNNFTKPVVTPYAPGGMVTAAVNANEERWKQHLNVPEKSAAQAFTDEPPF